MVIKALYLIIELLDMAPVVISLKMENSENVECAVFESSLCPYRVSGVHWETGS